MSQTAVYRTERELRNYRMKLRRQKEIKRNIMIAVIAAFVLILFALLFHSFTSQAKSNADDISYKYFTSIQVENGDSLWSIAAEYASEEHYDSKKDYITEVMVMNNLPDDEIVAGQYLVIPYYSYEYVQ